MKNIPTNETIKSICMIPSTVGLFECMQTYANSETTENPFDEKVYKISLNDWFDLEFSIMKETTTAAFPVYLDISTCTDVKQLIFQMVNSKEDTITYDYLINSMINRPASEKVKEFGIFGNDPVFYQGLKVIRCIKPKLEYYQSIDESVVNSIKRIK